MADKKITDLDPITTVQPTTLLVVVDDPTGTPVTKKATVSQLPAPATPDPLQTSTIQGGSGTTSTLTLKPTTGAGLGTALISLRVGNNGNVEGLHVRRHSFNAAVALVEIPNTALLNFLGQSAQIGLGCNGTDYLQIDSLQVLGPLDTLSVFVQGQLYFESNAHLHDLAAIWSPADGVLQLSDHLFNTFNRLQFGGTTNLFPALKRSGTTLAVRLADDSGDAPLTAATAAPGTNTTQVATTAFTAAAAASRPFRIGYTWGVVGAVAAATLNSIFVPMNGTQAAVLVSIRAKLVSGTSIVIQVKRNGTNVGSTITVTPTAATTSLGNVTLAADDELSLVTSTPTGSPVTLTATIAIEHTP